LPAGHVAHLQRGGELKFGRAQIGSRCWLAISGGIDVPVVLSSRSTDLRANFGGFAGRALRDGDVLRLGKRPGSPTPATAISSWSAPHDWVSPARRGPILLLGDCQTIGGYRKIAHVITVDLAIAAQLRAGDGVRFFEVSLQDAYRLLLERERDLDRFRIGLSLQRA